MGVPIANATPLAGGCIVAGIVLTLCTQTLWLSGFYFDLFHDRKRQTMLNSVCLVSAVTSLIAYPANQTGDSIWLCNITTLINFLCVQYGLVMVNHNSSHRLYTYLLTTKAIPRFGGYEKATKIAYRCMYLLPWLVFIPIYYAIATTMPKQMLNTSPYNKLIYKPLNIALIISTEALAISIDMLLLRAIDSSKQGLKWVEKLKSVFSGKKNNSAKIVGDTAAAEEAGEGGGISKEGQQEEDESPQFFVQISLDLFVNYALTWFLLLVDVVIKVLIIYGYPVLFDSIITILTLALRAKCNLQYNLDVQEVVLTGSLTSKDTVLVGHREKPQLAATTITTTTNAASSSSSNSSSSSSSSSANAAAVTTTTKPKAFPRRRSFSGLTLVEKEKEKVGGT